MSTLLSPELVTDSLHSLPGWEGGTEAIFRTFTLTPEQDALLRQQVAEAADAMDHHPDVETVVGGTRFLLSTHSAGGVTELDITLASRISDLAHHVAPTEAGVDAHRTDAPEITSAASDGRNLDEAPVRGFATARSGAIAAPLPPEHYSDDRTSDAYGNERL